MNLDRIDPAVLALAGTIAFLWAFWGLYVLVMGLYRAHLDKRLSRAAYVLAAPFLAVGAAVDVLANLTIASLVFLEPPREWLVTSRLQRHNRDHESGWRGDLSEWICTHLLDVFDPTGNHC
jgi:hypothetical protein